MKTPGQVIAEYIEEHPLTPYGLIDHLRKHNFYIVSKPEFEVIEPLRDVDGCGPYTHPDDFSTTFAYRGLADLRIIEAKRVSLQPKWERERIQPFVERDLYHNYGHALMNVLMGR